MSLMQESGVYNDALLKELVAQEKIRNAVEQDVGCCSLDMRLSHEVYRLPYTAKPVQGENIADMLRYMGAKRFDIAHPFEVGVTYLVRLKESLALDPYLFGMCNPKSSVGRNDIHVRTLIDASTRFDKVVNSYCGDVWLMVRCNSYPILFRENNSLVQLRIADGDARLDHQALCMALASESMLYVGDTDVSNDLYYRQDHDASLMLSFDLAQTETDSRVVAYEYNGCKKPLDFDRRDVDPEEYFSPLPLQKDGSLHAKKDSFIIGISHERVRIPPHLTCVMAAIDESSGEFRAHYAGYIDSGFGMGADNEGKGTALVMEMRPFEDMLIRPGQPVAKLRYERMKAVPEKHYDQMETSNYRGQKGPRLSKHFAQV